MGENGFVAIPKVKAPDLHILVSRASHDEFRIIGYVHSKNWKLMDLISEELQQKPDIHSLCDHKGTGNI